MTTYNNDRDQKWRKDAQAVLNMSGPSPAATQAARTIRLLDEVDNLEVRNDTQAKSILCLLDNEDKLALRDAECRAKADIIDGLERKLKRAKDSSKADVAAALERKVVHLEGRIERMRLREKSNSDAFKRTYERMLVAMTERDELAAKISRGRLKDANVDARTVVGVDHVMQFPKHRGETLAYVAALDPAYVVWLDEQHSTHRPSAEVLQIAYDVIAGAKRRERNQVALRGPDPVDKIRRGLVNTHGIDSPDETLIRATLHDWATRTGLRKSVVNETFWLGRDA